MFFVWINVKEINELFIKHWEREKNIYEIENRLYKLENEEETND